MSVISKDPEVKICDALYSDNICLNACKNFPYPSYYEGGKGKGCLIAHTLLSLYETYRIHKYTLKILKKRLGVLSDTILALTTILHDVGKLDKKYGSGTFKHNIVSSVLAKHLLENILDDRYVGEIVVAIFLHHEAYEWKYIGSFIPTLCDASRSPIPVEIELKDLKNFLRTTYKVFVKSKYFFIKDAKLFDNLFNKILYKNSLPSKADIGIICSLNQSVISNGLLLYYLLYLVDNRAATARRNKYWDMCQDKSMKTRPYMYSTPSPILQV